MHDNACLPLIANMNSFGAAADLSRENSSIIIDRTQSRSAGVH
jgi:hypothetical protein